MSNSEKFNSAASQAKAKADELITKATPVVSWGSPAAIVQGTALSGTQLNATANVPGTFSYTPAAGSVPATGVQTLKVSFTPTDAVDYAVATGSVALTVNAAAAAPAVTARLWVVSPGAGSTVSGQIVVTGYCRLQLDASGTHLLVDGKAIPGHVTEGPFLYPLDTRTLTNGPHVLQIWGHDTGNNTTVSAGVTVTVAN